MRRSRIVAVASIALAGLAASPVPAAADGGAWIEFDRTHYLPGDGGVGTAYVSVPKEKQHLLERGPFYAFLVTGNRGPQEGKPIPSDAIRVGTFEVHHERGAAFELSGHITIPDVPGDLYSVAFCNDPCTIAGFKEPLTGFVSIVQTRREARLLDQREHLTGRIGRLERQLRKGNRELEALQAEFDARARDRAYLADEVNRLNDELARSRAAGRRASERARRLGTLAALAAALLVVAIVLVARRRRAPATRIPDTAEELMSELGVGTKG